MKLAEALALAPRPRAKRRHDEDDFQESVINLLRTILHPRDFRVFSVPNGGNRDPREAARLKRTGVLAGVYDIVILGPSGQTYWIECKTDDGELSEPQRAMDLFMIAGGVPHVVARRLADVEAAVAHWGLRTRCVA